MASSPSGPYQSRILGSVLRSARRWRDRTTIAWRQMQTTVSWTAQILLYPIYALFQTTRWVGASLHQVTSRFRLSQASANASGADGSSQLSSDTPVQRVLAALQMALAPESATSLLQFGQPSVDEGWDALEAELHDAEALKVLVQAPTWFGLTLFQPLKLQPLAQGEPTATALLPLADTAAQGAIAPTATAMQRPVWIRGVASCLATRALVLVSSHNQPLNILTADQQQQLQQRIVWEVATYLYERRQQSYRLFGRLRLPAPKSRALPPIQAFQRLMAWMQSGSVAIATNLFQEARLAPPPCLFTEATAALEPRRRFIPLMPSATLPQEPRALPAAPGPKLMPPWSNTLLAGLPFPWVKQSSGHNQPLALPGLPTPSQPVRLLQPAPSLSRLFHWRNALLASLPFTSVAPLTPALVVLPPVASEVAQVLRSPTEMLNPVSKAEAGHGSGLELAVSGAYSSPSSTLASQGASIDSEHSHVTPSFDYIDTKATLLGYIQTPLERVLQWIDGVLLQLEAWLGHVIAAIVTWWQSLRP